MKSHRLRSRSQAIRTPERQKGPHRGFLFSASRSRAKVAQISGARFYVTWHTEPATRAHRKMRHSRSFARRTVKLHQIGAQDRDRLPTIDCASRSDLNRSAPDFFVYACSPIPNRRVLTSALPASGEWPLPWQVVSAPPPLPSRPDHLRAQRLAGSTRRKPARRSYRTDWVRNLMSIPASWIDTNDRRSGWQYFDLNRRDEGSLDRYELAK